HLVPWINRARKAGARLVVVDPRRTVIARRADLHLALRPGTDVVLAWAVAAELERRGGIDRAFVGRHVEGVDEFMALARRWSVSDAARVCGVPEEDVRALAEWYTRSPPRRSAWATGSSETRTAAAASARSSRCPRSPGSSA